MSDERGAERDPDRPPETDPFIRAKRGGQALQEYRKTMSNRNAVDAVDALDGQNPVPASLVVKTKEPRQVESVANQIGTA